MNIVVLGKGGHSGVVARAIYALGHVVEGFFEEIEGVPIIAKPIQAAFIAIGNNEARERLSKLDFLWVNIAHPSASIARMDCTGSFFGVNSVVGNNSRVGSFSVINTGVILEHDSTLGDFCHLCPGVVTGGRVKIGSRTTIGLGAMIRDGVTIGNNVVIGMGSNVLNDIPDNSVAFGNPCKIQP